MTRNSYASYVRHIPGKNRYRLDPATSLTSCCLHRDRPRPRGILLGTFGGTVSPEPSRPLLPVEHPLGARGSRAGLSDGRPGRPRVYRASRSSNSSAPDGRHLVGIAHFDPLPVAARNAPSNRGGQEKALACALRRRAAHARRSASCALDFLTSRCESLSRAGRSMVVLDPPPVRVVSVSRLHFARRSARSEPVSSAHRDGRGPRGADAAWGRVVWRLSPPQPNRVRGW